MGFAWVAALAFLRLVTKLGLFPSPASTEQATRQLDDWSAQPAAQILQPTSRHATVLAQLMADTGATGSLITDARLAALVIEHRATVVSYDNDFGRFPGVRWERPSRG